MMWMWSRVVNVATRRNDFGGKARAIYGEKVKIYEEKVKVYIMI